MSLVVLFSPSKLSERDTSCKIQIYRWGTIYAFIDDNSFLKKEDEIGKNRSSKEIKVEIGRDHRLAVSVRKLRKNQGRKLE